MSRQCSRSLATQPCGSPYGEREGVGGSFSFSWRARRSSGLFDHRASGVGSSGQECHVILPGMLT